MSNADTEKAKAVANAIRHLWPDKAAEIDRLVAAAESGKCDGVKVKVGVRFKLEKFEGEIVPGKQPYETIEGEDARTTPCP